jgi:hypothetical protein
VSAETTKRLIVAALRKREANGGRHLHHRECIHNLPPEQQIAVRGKTVAWWETFIGPMPVQITPDQWETEPLALPDA